MTHQVTPTSTPDAKRTRKDAERNERAFLQMLQMANRNHYPLNQMVDRKARILLSVNALVLSLVIGSCTAAGSTCSPSSPSAATAAASTCSPATPCTSATTRR